MEKDRRKEEHCDRIAIKKLIKVGIYGESMGNVLQYLERSATHLTFNPFVNDNRVIHIEIMDLVECVDVIIEYFTKNPLVRIATLDHYIDYFSLKKMISYKKYIPSISSEVNQLKINSLLEKISGLYRRIKPSELVAFINVNYQVLLAKEENQKYVHATYDTYTKYHRQMDGDVLLYLIHHYSYKLFYDYDRFQNRLEKEISMFKELFSEENVNLNLELNPQYLYEVIVSIKLRKPNSLFKELKQSVDLIVCYVENLCQEITDENVVTMQLKIKEVLDFLRKIKDNRLTQFQAYYVETEILRENHLMKTGHQMIGKDSFSSIQEHVNRKQDLRKKLLAITHNNCENQWKADLNKSPIDYNTCGDVDATNLVNCNYYKVSHQNLLAKIVDDGGARIEEILRDVTLFQESRSWYISLLEDIGEYYGCETRELEQEFLLLYQMLQNVYGDGKQVEPLLQQSVCYGAATFICGYIEKLLRSLYYELKKEETYIAMAKVTLGQLLSQGNTVYRDIFGEYQLKHLRYFLLTDGQQKIGFNYRNQLAHWMQIEPDKLESRLVARLMYLLTSVMNSLVDFERKNSANIIKTYENNEKFR
ncbi:MAG: hypothetical protein R3Y54_04165 [Eubacteriales bacterium]